MDPLVEALYSKTKLVDQEKQKEAARKVFVYYGAVIVVVTGLAIYSL